MLWRICEQGCIQIRHRVSPVFLGVFVFFKAGRLKIISSTRNDRPDAAQARGNTVIIVSSFILNWRNHFDRLFGRVLIFEFGIPLLIILK